MIINWEELKDKLLALLKIKHTYIYAILVAMLISCHFSFFRGGSGGGSKIKELEGQVRYIQAQRDEALAQAVAIGFKNKELLAERDSLIKNIEVKSAIIKNNKKNLNEEIVNIESHTISEQYDFFANFNKGN